MINKIDDIIHVEELLVASIITIEDLAQYQLKIASHLDNIIKILLCILEILQSEKVSSHTNLLLLKTGLIESFSNNTQFYSDKIHTSGIL